MSTGDNEEEKKNQRVKRQIRNRRKGDVAQQAEGKVNAPAEENVL